MFTYFEVIDRAIDLIRMARLLCKLESLLCHPKQDDFKDIFQLYRKDLDQECLITQLHILCSKIPCECFNSQNVVIYNSLNYPTKILRYELV